MSDKYYSYDEERYDLTEIEDAIEQLLEEDTKGGDTVFVWEGDSAKAGVHPGVNLLIEAMQERAFEEVGEYADSWLTQVTSLQAAELQSGLDSLIDNWLEAHKHTPQFFTIKNAKRVEIRITNLPGDGGFEFERI